MRTRPNNPSLEFDDPLENTPKLELGNADELISQLAGDEIDRLISSDDNITPLSESELALSAPVRPPAQKPTVEELAARLDQVFEEIRTREPAPPPVKIDLSAPAPITLPEPVLAMRRYDETEPQDVHESQGRRSLLEPIEEPSPAVMRWLAWVNAPVAQLSRGPRMMVSVISLLSFTGSVAALVYVLMLRRGM